MIEDIWTYIRAPGCRTVLPWATPGLPGGPVQLDCVFNERLPEAPRAAEPPGGTIVRTAAPEPSLAWKVMWLITDMHGPHATELPSTAAFLNHTAVYATDQHLSAEFIAAFLKAEADAARCPGPTSSSASATGSRSTTTRSATSRSSRTWRS
ncbi:hypothetical protein [Streptomyces aureus]|uniref:hypothetical protein n=1 Tax=Streptomyces aureus TaxID=193461 RepID=UPI0005664064